jgi:ABC-type transporter Mla MlaB component
MLRITTHTTDDEIVIKLEGCLAGPWVRELDNCWRGAAAGSDTHVRVDLSGVCHVDATGRALMTAMYAAGVRFLATGCLMPEVVREISESVESRASALKEL